MRRIANHALFTGCHFNITINTQDFVDRISFVTNIKLILYNIYFFLFVIKFLTNLQEQEY